MIDKAIATVIYLILRYPGNLQGEVFKIQKFFSLHFISYFNFVVL